MAEYSTQKKTVFKKCLEDVHTDNASNPFLDSLFCLSYCLPNQTKTPSFPSVAKPANTTTGTLAPTNIIAILQEQKKIQLDTHKKWQQHSKLASQLFMMPHISSDFFLFEMHHMF